MERDTAHQLHQCGFCYQINLVSEGTEHPTCMNCGLDLKRDLPLDPEEPPLKGAGVGDAPVDEQLVTELPEPELPEPRILDPEDVPAKRIPKWAIAVAAASVLVLTGGAVATIAALSATSNEKEADDVAAVTPTVRVTGWEETPAWVTDVFTTQATESSDGTALGVRVGDTARVIDAQTGDTVATQQLGDRAAPGVYRAGDMLLASDADATYIWTSDTGDNTETDAGWRQVDVPDEATLSIRGDAALAVTTVGASYLLIEDDATLSPLLVPTDGAVPVAATNDTITWGTNARVVYVTNRDGDVQDQATLSPPSNDATIDRWVGGDATHTYVLWETGDTLTLAVHDTDTGDVTATHLISEAERDATPITTRDGATSAFATLLINTTTGAISDAGTNIIGEANEAFIGQDVEDGYALVDSDGTVRDLGNQQVVPLAGTGEGYLVVASSGILAALDPVPGTNGQTDNKENDEEVDQ